MRARTRDQEDYFLARRRLGGLVSSLTYAATTYSAFMMIGLVGLTYSTGVGALGFELLYLVGTLFLLRYYAPRIWELSRKEKIVSPSELISLKHGRNSGRLSAVISLFALIPYTSVQLIGVALLLNRFGVPFHTGIILTGFIVALWGLLGGMRGIAWTDAFQGGIMLFSALALVSWVHLHLGGSLFIGTEEKILEVPNEFWTPVKFISLATPWFFFSLTNPQVLQRVFVPKNKLALGRMIVLFGSFGLVYTVLVTLLGLELRFLTENGVFPKILDRDLVTPTLLGLVPEWLLIAVSLSIVAAAITTANSIVLTLSSMLSRDVLGEKRRVVVGKMGIVGLTIMVMAFASKRPDYIVELAVLSSTILLCQLPSILGTIHLKKTGKHSSIFSMISGFLTSTLMAIYSLNPLGIPYSVWTLLISLSVYLLLLRLER
ncbi:sodium:solute symporter family protein [Thermococci archaeon]|nr:MAG: sodium:solute symporter family protein [Thermococci archaeon]